MDRLNMDQLNMCALVTFCVRQERIGWVVTAKVYSGDSVAEGPAMDAFNTREAAVQRAGELSDELFDLIPQLCGEK